MEKVDFLGMGKLKLLGLYAFLLLSTKHPNKCVILFDLNKCVKYTHKYHNYKYIVKLVYIGAKNRGKYAPPN